MIKFILALLFLTISCHGEETDILPINSKGRFRPLYTEKTDLSNLELKMLPSKRHPENWLPLKVLKDQKTNPTLFSNADFERLQKAYATSPENFANVYLDVYKPLTKNTYALSKSTIIHFPTIGQLKAEVWYYKWPLINYAILGYLGAVILFLLNEGFHKSFLQKAAWISFGIAFLLHSLVLALRIYILQRPPVSGMAETVIYVPWISTILSAFLSYRFKTSFPAITGAGLAACLLTILQWTFTAEPLDNVQAVLNSQFWLTVHVLMIVASYGALILAGVLGHVYLINQLWKKDSPKILEALIQCLYVGIALLIPGTILGGVWAAQSWGRFWDWDPKESWAFISACVYLLIIHAYRFRKIGGLGLSIGSIAGLLSISFTWYGVNYILGTGLHSYGFGSGGEWIYYTYVFLELAFIALCLTKFRLKSARNI